jgi:hypothetical protein
MTRPQGPSSQDLHDTVDGISHAEDPEYECPATAPATALAATTCERTGLNKNVGRIVP